MNTGPTTRPAEQAGHPPPATQQARPTLRLRDPRHRVHPRAIAWWTVRPLMFWLVVVLGLTAVRVFAAPPSWIGWAQLAAGVVGVLHVAVMPQWRYRVHRWECTDAAVYTRTGWLNQEWRVAPASRIQTVDTKRGPLEQLFGLSTVTVTTASAAGPVEIAGLAQADASALVEELTATTQAIPGDAT